MYQNFISHHFSNQSGIIIVVNLATCPLRSSPIDWGGFSGAGFSVDVITERDCETGSVDVKWLANSPVQWPSWTRRRTWWNHSWHSSRVTLNQRCFPSFVRALLWCISESFRGLRATALFVVAPDHCSTVEQLLYWSDWIWTGRAALIDAKTKLDSGI